MCQAFEKTEVVCWSQHTEREQSSYKTVFAERNHVRLIELLLIEKANQCSFRVNVQIYQCALSVEWRQLW